MSPLPVRRRPEGPEERTGARARRELAAALAALTAALVAVLLTAGLISRDLQHSSEQAYARQAIPVRTSVQDLLVQMLNQETGVRGFVLLGQPATLQPYFAGRRAAARDLARLGRLARDQPPLRAPLATARGQIAALQDYFASQVALVRSGPAGRQRARARTQTGRGMFDVFRGTTHRMARVADRVVAEAVDHERARYRDLLVVLGIVGGIGLAMAIALALIVPRRARQVLEERARRLAEERRTRATLDRVISAGQRFATAGSPDELRRRICEGALEAFGCAAASLWEIGTDELRLVARAPWSDLYAHGDRRPIDELPGLREALAAGRPQYVPDLRQAARGATERTAEAAGTVSLLNLPIVAGGRPELMLGLLWERVIEPPSAGQRAAAQRFADQAGLALEQSRRRRAQAEVESLNRTLQQMVQTEPLLRSGATWEDVVEAICSGGRRIFDAVAAALWVRDGDAIELVHRQPPAEALPAGTRLSLDRYPTFREDFDRGRPGFEPDIERGAPDLWQTTARWTRSRSQLRLPLSSAGDVTALVVLSWPERVAEPSPAERALAARFADQAAVALVEAQRRQAARAAERLHDQLERSLLPTLDVRDPGVEVAALYRPGDERLRLGGDFYDCVTLPGGRLGVLIGDVSGHGPAAAALGAGLRAAWRALSLAGLPAQDVLPAVERVLVRERESPDLFVTALSGTLDPGTGRLELACAGHPPPLVLGGPLQGDLRRGPPLGALAGAGWPLSRLRFEAPVSIVLYTDGLIEGRAAAQATERFGVARLEAALTRGSRPGEVGEADLRRLVAAATEAHGAGLPDDVAVLALSVRG